MAKGAKTSLGESELLLIIDMCNEGIAKCHAREKAHARDRNNPAAEWDRRLRERYTHLRHEILIELEHRRRTVGVQTGEEGNPPEAAGKGHNEPPAQ